MCCVPPPADRWRSAGGSCGPGDTHCSTAAVRGRSHSVSRELPIMRSVGPAAQVWARSRLGEGVPCDHGRARLRGRAKPERASAGGGLAGGVGGGLVGPPPGSAAAIGLDSGQPLPGERDLRAGRASARPRRAAAVLGSGLTPHRPTPQAHSATIRLRATSSRAIDRRVKIMLFSSANLARARSRWMGSPDSLPSIREWLT